MSPLSCSFFIFWLVSVLLCLAPACNFSSVATCLSIQLPALLFVCVLFLLSVDVLFGQQSRTKDEGWSTANEFKPPSNFIAGRPKAALPFCFVGGFRCGCFVIYRYFCYILI